eukprot:RCo039834
MELRVGSVLRWLSHALMAAAGNLLGQYLAYLLLQYLWHWFARRGRVEDGSSTEPIFRSPEEAAAALGLSPNASRREIQRAFMNFHPDKGAVVSPAQFHHKALAYQFLRKHRQALGTWADGSPQS